MLGRCAAVLVAGMLMAAATPVAADDVEPLLPPAEFQGSYNATTQEVHLQWEAPSADATYAYNVYRNGALLNTTTTTNHTDTLPLASVVAYHVTATTLEGEHAGQESAPAGPFILIQSPRVTPATLIQLAGDHVQYEGAGNIPGLDCPIVRLWVINDPPFVSYTIYERCIPLVGSSLGLDDHWPVEG